MTVTKLVLILAPIFVLADVQKIPYEESKINTPVSSNNKVQLNDYHCKNSNGYEAVTNKCDKYIECNNNNAYEAKCLFGLYYDESVKYPSFPCNFPNFVQCQVQVDIVEARTTTTSTTTSTTSTTTTTQKPTEPTQKPTEPTQKPTALLLSNNDQLNNYKCKHADAFEAVPNTCDQFFICKNTYSHKTACPKGLYFDDSVKYPDFPCDYPTKVQCQKESTFLKTVNHADKVKAQTTSTTTSTSTIIQKPTELTWRPIQKVTEPIQKPWAPTQLPTKPIQKLTDPLQRPWGPTRKPTTSTITITQKPTQPSYKPATPVSTKVQGIDYNTRPNLTRNCHNIFLSPFLCLSNSP